MDRLSVGPLPRPDTMAVDYSGLDPTLDSCCRRDAEDHLKATAKRTVLKQHDRVAAYERTRRQQQPQAYTNPHLVTVKMMSNHHDASFEGCRCSYDPTKDGGHDYPALAELRRMLNENERLEGDENKTKGDSDDDDELDAFMEGFGGGKGTTGTSSSRAKASRTGADDNFSDSDDDDDDPLLVELDDSPALSEWERQRKQQLIEQIQRLETAKQHGYGGVHRPMHPSRVLRVAGLMVANTTAAATAAAPRTRSRIPPSSCLVHLYDPNSAASASLDVLVEQVLAPRYLGTMFLRSNGYDTVRLERNLFKAQASSNHSRVGRAITELVDHPADSLPALLVLQNGHIVNAIGGYHRPEWNWIDPSTGHVVSEAVQTWLEHCDSSSDDASSPVLRRDPPPLNEMCHLRPEELALLDYLRQSGNGATHSNRSRETLLTALECGVDGGRSEGNHEDDFDSHDYYECGLPGCRKPYAHQHVGNGVGDPGESSSTTSGLPFTLGD